LIGQGLTSHQTYGHIGDNFYRSYDQTNSVKALKETDHEIFFTISQTYTASLLGQILFKMQHLTKVTIFKIAAFGLVTSNPTDLQRFNNLRDTQTTFPTVKKPLILIIYTNKIAFHSSKHAFYSCDLDLNPMTLIYKLNLYPLKMNLHAKSELFWSRLSNVTELQTDRHTDVTVTVYISMSHSPVVI